MVSYLTLSFLSGFVELGAVILVIRSEQPMYQIPLIGLAYQMGALFREPIELPSWQYYIAFLLSAFSSIFAIQSPMLLFPAIFFLSVGIQGTRGMVSEQHKIGTVVKRVSRVLGFACSGFLSLKILPVIAGIALLAILPLAKNYKTSPRISVKNNLKPGPLGWIMMIHQSHYFSYAYIVPLLFIANYKIDPKMAGLLFCIGWLSYISSQKLFGEKALIRSFIIGHILVSVTLALAFFYFDNSLVFLLTLWFLTGFGGGTVYCLRKLRASSTTDKSDLDSLENVGHVFGLLVCVAILKIYNVPQTVFVIASLLAATTLILFSLKYRKQLLKPQQN